MRRKKRIHAKVSYIINVSLLFILHPRPGGTNLISILLMAKITDGGIRASGSKTFISRDLCQ